MIDGKNLDDIVKQCGSDEAKAWAVFCYFYVKLLEQRGWSWKVEKDE